MLSNHFTFSKRSLGWLLVISGGLGVIAIVGVDVLDIGREGGIGPAQRIAIELAVVMLLIGLTLIPLGKDPA
ncbi:MAG: hypothetical protein ABI690_13730 [Chloroflexota bacterium]